MIRLMLADDHRMLREGLRRSMTEEGFDIVGEAQDGVEAVELPGHPFYLATLFQPQMESLTTGVLHPILGALIAAAHSAHPTSV